MSNLERIEHAPEHLDSVKELFSQALSCLQWTDVSDSTLADQAPMLIQDICLFSHQAASALLTASVELEKQAKELRQVLDGAKTSMSERKPQEVGMPSGTACLHKSLVLNQLYERVDSPICYLQHVIHLPRIIMKRRAFT